MEHPCVEVTVKVCMPEARRKRRWFFTMRFGPSQFTVPITTQEEFKAMAVTPLPMHNKLTWTVSIKDAAGNDAYVADPVWSVTGPITILSSEPPVAARGAKVALPQYSCTVAAGAETGTADVTFTCDADLSPDSTKQLIAVGTMVIAPGEATVVELVPGTPEPV